MKLSVGVISLGFPNFRWDIANEYYKRSLDILAENKKLELSYTDNIIIDLDILDDEISKIKKANIDILLIQCGTYSHGDALMRILNEFKGVPLFLWGFPEPMLEGSRDLPLNSLCGLNMYASFLKKLKVKFSYVYGDFEDKEKRRKLEDTFDALLVKKKMNKTKYCIVGGRVPGFYLSNVDEVRFRDEIGPSITYYSIASLLEDSENIPDDIVERDLEEAKLEVDRVCVTDEKLKKSMKVYRAILNFKEENKIDCFAIKCWPEFQSIKGISVCAVMAKLNNAGILSSCEGDITGLATMQIQNELAGEVPFFADLVNVNDRGTLKTWHCGTGAHSLAKKGTLCYTEHPTIKNGVGTAIEMEVKTGQLVMNKLSEGENYRLFLATGRGIDVDRDLAGVQADISLDRGIDEVLDGIIENGIEHHFSVSYSDITSKIKEYCKWSNIELIDYSK